MDQVKGFDLHQFAVFNSEYCGEAERCHREQCYNCMGRNDEKSIIAWQRLLSDWHPKQMHSGRLHRLMKKGVPHHLRGTIWKQLLQIEALKERSQFSYQADQLQVRDQLVNIGVSEYSHKGNFGVLHDEELLTDYNPKGSDLNLNTIRDIILDLDRSFPTHRMFIDGCPDGIEGRASLFRILAGYARYNADVGYCQGMSYVAGMLLMNLVEADAFWCFVALMERQKFLRGYYDEHLKKIRRHSDVFKKLFNNKLPALSNHLTEKGVVPDMYIIPWFLSLFTNIQCWDSVLAIWDLFILDGMLALFRASLALLSVLETELLQCDDLSHILPCLLHPSLEKVHFEILVPILWALTLEDWEVKYMEAVIQEETVNPQLSMSTRKRAIEEAEVTMSPKRPRRSLNNNSNNNTTLPDNDAENLSIFQRFKQVFFRRNSQPTPGSVQGNHRAAVYRRRASATSRKIVPQINTPNRSLEDSIDGSIGDSTGGDIWSGDSFENKSCEDVSMEDILVVLTSPPKSVDTPIRSSPRFRSSPRLNNNFFMKRNLNTPTHQNVPKQASTLYTFKAFSSLKPLRMSDQEMGCPSPMEMTELRKSKILKEKDLNTGVAIQTKD